MRKTALKNHRLLWLPFDSAVQPHGGQPETDVNRPDLILGHKRKKEVRWLVVSNTYSRWWFQTFFIFTPIWGNDPILTNIFEMGGSTTN